MDFYDVNKIKLKGIDDKDEYVPEEECGENIAAVSQLAKKTLRHNYDFINAVVISVIFIIVAVGFVAVTGDNSIDDQPAELSVKSFLSGEYEQKIEDKYIQQLPFPDEIKVVKESVARIYGIGNKAAHSWVKEDDGVDADHNSFDEQETEETVTTENKPEPDEIVITTVSDKNKPVTTTSGEKNEEDKKQTTVVTTPAIAHPASTWATVTTTTENTTTTTNNKAPGED